MTPAALTLARDGAPAATAPALATWTAIVARVAPAAASASLDMVAKLLDADTDVPPGILQESIVRLGLFLVNTEGVLGYSAFETDATKIAQYSEFHGSAVRRSGVSGLLGPWVVPVAGVI